MSSRVACCLYITLVGEVGGERTEHEGECGRLPSFPRNSREHGGSTGCTERVPPPDTSSPRGVCAPSHRVGTAAQWPCPPRKRGTCYGGAAGQWTRCTAHTPLDTRLTALVARGAACNGAYTRCICWEPGHPARLDLASRAAQWMVFGTASAPLHATHARQ